ncbi:MAG: DUF2807 domain-containing protein [Saprospiraceae bacterium]|nr:DUF2807 domain-containing protein [Saprospiraceae bacterium]
MGLLSLAACDPMGVKGEGDIVSETRNPDAFNRVNIDVYGKTEIYHADAYRVEIDVEESILPYLETEVNDGRLDVYFSRNVRNVDGLRVRIYTPSDLQEIDFDGSGTLIAYDSLTYDQLRIDHDGSGEVYIKKAFTGHLGVKLSGSGKIDVDGYSEDLTLTLSGSGEINSLDLDARFADVSLSGSGEIKCSVSEAIHVNLSGSGNVWYAGDPDTNITVSGSGKVRKF